MQIKMSVKVAVVIVSYKGKADTLECLASLESLDYDNYSIILVDQNSGDGVLEEVTIQFPKVVCLANPTNNGFAGGNNLGIDYALKDGAEAVFLLNNDTIIAPDLLSAVVAKAEGEERIGLVGPTMFYYDHPTTVWSLGGWLNYRADATQIGDGLSEEAAIAQLATRPPDYFVGCGLYIKQAVLEEIGLLPEEYFLYYEETDFCVRARRAGWQLAHAPEGKLWHKISRSTGRDSPLTLYYMRRNALLFVERYHPKIDLLRLWGRDMHMLCVYIARRKPEWRPHLRAMIDYVLRRFDKRQI
jgi:GT2 family glycosyltransferase